MKIIKTGNVGGKNTVEVRPPKPMHVPDFDELVVLADRYYAYKEYAESVSSTRRANNAWAVASKIKRCLDKMYKRWLGN